MVADLRRRLDHDTPGEDRYRADAARRAPGAALHPARPSDPTSATPAATTTGSNTKAAGHCANPDPDPPPEPDPHGDVPPVPTRPMPVRFVRFGYPVSMVSVGYALSCAGLRA
ncbi:MAG: hypothetical protein JO268_21025 [Pseudonocardiales bacterium]|nr:hypothetical protein [Pseudonocardiales bacterium]